MRPLFPFILLLTCLLRPSLLLGADFVVGGVGYNRLDDSRVAVAPLEAPYAGQISIPAAVTWADTTYSVVAVTDRAFASSSRLTFVSLPEGLQRIGCGAFTGCTALRSLALPATLLAIGAEAFYGCSRLVAIALPATTDSVGREAFTGCSALRMISVAAANASLASVDGVLMNKNHTALLAYPAARATTYDVPPGVTDIDACAFAHCKRLAEVSLPASLRRVGDAAFYGCTALARVSLAEGVQQLGEWAFAECPALTTMSLPATLTTVGSGAFSFCPALQNIFVAAGNAALTSQGGVLFDRALTTLLAYPGAKGPAYRVPAGTDSIAQRAFYGATALRSVTLSAATARLSGSAFVFCDSLGEILVDHSNRHFVSEQGVLMNKDKTQLVFCPNARSGAFSIPDTVTDVPAGPFMLSSALTALSIPAGVERIADWAFLGCTGLRAVGVPHSLKSLGEQPFADSHALRTIINGGCLLPVSDFAPTVDDSATLYVPLGLEANYRSLAGWRSIDSLRTYGVAGGHTATRRRSETMVPVLLSQNLPISALQMRLTLPDGLSLAQDEGYYRVELAGNNARTHRASCTPVTRNSYLILIYPRQNDVLSGDTLLHVGVVPAAGCATGAYTIDLGRISLTYALADVAGEATERDVTAAINVAPALGDVNANSRINVADVVEILNYLQDKPATTFHADEADVNANGTITLADALALVDRLPAELSTATLGATTYATDALGLNGFTATPGSTFSLPVALNNTTGGLTAFQFMLTLPRGFELATNALGGWDARLGSRYSDPRQALSIARMADGNEGATRYLVTGYSPAVLPLTGTNGPLLTLTGRVAADVATTTYNLRLSNIVLADTAATEYFLAPVQAQATVNDLVGIDRIERDGLLPADIYDAQGILVRRQAKTLSTLPPGIYIIKGLKVLIQ